MADTKPSIYSSPTQEVRLVPAEPTWLGQQIGQVRQSIHEATASVRSQANSTRTSWVQKESQLESRVASVVDNKEMTAQNGFNVAIALLGGSILSRSRGFLLRSLFPLATGLGAAAYFLPNTMYNVDQAWYRWELQNAPALADARQQVRGQLSNLRDQIRGLTGK